MPYIKDVDRDKINDSLVGLIDAIRSANFTVVEMPGVLNYCISSLLNVARPVGGWNYFTINSIMGVISCVSAEFYRRLAGPYEDIKIKQNGDIVTYRG